jgi:hypothetical protein
MIMEGILKNWRGFVNEGVTPEGKIELKYYAFDWDDNVMMMPTEIIFNNVEVDAADNTETIKGEVLLSTEEFAHERGKIGKPFEFKGEMVDLRYLPNDNSFINFRDNPKANTDFIAQAQTAPLGPVFNDFAKAVNEASYFAIITARGHSKDTLREACYATIKEQRGGISLNTFLTNFNVYRKVFGQSEINDVDLALREYLKDGNCQFSPVSHPSIAGAGKGGASSPEELKKEQFKQFSNRMRRKATDLRNLNKQAEQIDQGFLESGEFQIGFSDDDIRNAKAMANMLKKSRTSSVYHTTPSGKVRLNVPRDTSGQR